jgi:hypothetical protein
MNATLEMISPFAEQNWRRLSLAVVTGLVCAVAITRRLPVATDAISAIPAPLCADDASGSSLNKVEVIDSHALPNVPGKKTNCSPCELRSRRIHAAAPP